VFNTADLSVWKNTNKIVIDDFTARDVINKFWKYKICVSVRLINLILDTAYRNNRFKSVCRAWLWAGLMANRFKNKIHGTVCPSFFFATFLHRLVTSDSFVCFILHRPFTGCYNKFYEKGTYTCIVCNQELFSSDTKYDSGCGWPAFNEVLDQGRIKLTKDTSHSKQF